MPSFVSKVLDECYLSSSPNCCQFTLYCKALVRAVCCTEVFKSWIQIEHLNSKIQNPKCFKIWNFLSADMMPHMENSTPDLMWQGAVKTHNTQFIWHPQGKTKITLRLCAWGLYETDMNLVFRLGSIPKITHLCLCKYSEVWKQSEIGNTSGSEAFWIRDVRPV